MNNPYPLGYALRWPWYHVRPSTRRHSEVGRRPLAYRFAAAEDSLRVLFFGDLMGLTGDRVPSCSPAIQRLFGAADLVIGNLESPVIHDRKRRFAYYVQTFQLGTAYLDEFFQRFNLMPARCMLSVANNHVGDQGARGVGETIRRLGGLGVTAFGAFEPGAVPITTRAAKGLTLGVAGWTHWLNRAFDDRALAVLRTEDAARYPWREARARLGLDCLIANPHWEWEFQHFPCRETVGLARSLAASGFDLLVGHHPHVVQPLEWFPGPRANAPPTICHFSLGNLFARTVTWPHRLLILLETEIASAGPDRGRVIAYRCHPAVQLGHWPRIRIASLAEAPPGWQRRMRARLALLFATEDSEYAVHVDR